MSTADGFENLMKQAQQMQDNIKKAQNELSSLEVEGVAAAGLVKVVMNGRYDATRLHIDDSLINKDDKEMLEDCIIAAINDAVRNIEKNSRNKMSGLMQGINLPEGFELPIT